MAARQNYSEDTRRRRAACIIGFFLDWCDERGLDRAGRKSRGRCWNATSATLYHYRKKNGEPLTFRSQHAACVPLRAWFSWMARQNHILHNPASELELPRLENRCPSTC